MPTFYIIWIIVIVVIIIIIIIILTTKTPINNRINPVPIISSTSISSTPSAPINNNSLCEILPNLNLPINKSFHNAYLGHTDGTYIQLIDKKIVFTRYPITKFYYNNDSQILSNGIFQQKGLKFFSTERGTYIMKDENGQVIKYNPQTNDWGSSGLIDLEFYIYKERS